MANPFPACVSQDGMSPDITNRYAFVRTNTPAPFSKGGILARFFRAWWQQDLSIPIFFGIVKSFLRQIGKTNFGTIFVYMIKKLSNHSLMINQPNFAFMRQSPPGRAFRVGLVAAHKATSGEAVPGTQILQKPVALFINFFHFFLIGNQSYRKYFSEIGIHLAISLYMYIKAGIR